MTKTYDEAFQEERAESLRDFGDREVILGHETLLFKVNVPYGVFVAMDEMRNVDPLSSFRRAEELIFTLVEGDPEAIERARIYLRENYTAANLLALLNKLIEDNAGRPTQAPSSSEDGRNGTGTNSTDDSSTPPAEDSPA